MNTFRSRSRQAHSYDLLPPERPKPRSIPERLTRPSDVVDAEFVVIRDPARIDRARPYQTTVRPQNDNGTARRTRTAPSTLHRSASLAERLLGRLPGNLFSGLVALVFLAIFALTGGFTALASSGGKTAPIDPVDFTHVTVSMRTVSGIPMMVVNGIIENHGAGALVSPRLRADVYSGEIMLSTTLFDPRLGMIGEGESRGFQVKLPQAGGKTPEVRLSLAD